MARKFLTAVDLAKNELQNAAIQSLASAPSAPVKFQLYGNSADNTLYWWDGSGWVPAKATGTGFPGYGTVPAATTFGITKSDGAAVTVARSDHTHGTPTHLNADHAAINLSAHAAAIADVSMGGFQVKNLALSNGTPTDAASVQYVLNRLNGMLWKYPADAATTGNITLSGQGQTVDGVTVVASISSVLVKNQTTASQNGLYDVQVGAWTRRVDADADTELVNAAVFIKGGTVNADTQWVCTNDNAAFNLGTTAITWAQVSGPGSIGAGAGLTQTGNTLDVVGDASITVAADQISRAALTGDVTASAGSNATTIAANAVTNAKLAQMPFSSFKGNILGAPGPAADLTQAQAAQLLNGLVAPRKFGTASTAGTATTVTHNFNSRDVMVVVYDTLWNEVECDVEHTDFNYVTVRFATAVAFGDYRIVVIG